MNGKEMLLTFGTGGLRAKLGPAPDQMNEKNIEIASAGLANYLLSRESLPSVAIGYDSRIKSDVFASVAANCFAAKGVKVYMWPRLMPVPCVSFAVRCLGCSAGVMVTASHNPSQYNGYKVYGADGCQITTKAAADIQQCIREVDEDSASSGAPDGMIEYIPDEVYDAYISEIKKLSVLYGETPDRELKIVYTPLNGAGLKPVTRILEESGFENVTVVREQEDPDGNFPTCPKPNPEEKEAMALAVKYARDTDADIVLATDPDCDRVGVAVKAREGEYEHLTGNEIGLLLFEYICEQRTANGCMPEEPVLVKTVVTTNLADKIAERYGVKVINTLTGFKFIGEQISGMSDPSNYLFGFEESYGYLSGTHVRDKDGVNAVFLITEMCALYKSRGKTLTEKLQELYGRYGYCLNTLHSYEFDGAGGKEKIRKIVESFKSISTYAYAPDVLEVRTDGGTYIVRPSGTEPKLKVYCSVISDSKAEAQKKEETLFESINNIVAKVD